MKKSKGRQSSKMEVTILYNLIMEETPIIFVKFCPLEASYLVHPTLKERGHCLPSTDRKTNGGGESINPHHHVMMSPSWRVMAQIKLNI